MQNYSGEKVFFCWFLLNTCDFKLRRWSADCFLYITDCILVLAGMQQASINLTQSLHEVYEPDWHGKDDVMIIGKVRIVETPIWQGDTWTNHTNITEQLLNAPNKHDWTTPMSTIQTWQNNTWTHHNKHYRTTLECITGAGLHSTFLSFSVLIYLDICHVCQYLALFANMLVCIPTSRHIC